MEIPSANDVSARKPSSRWASLVSRTARLPRVELTAPPSVIGKNTVECIQSALIYGTADMVDGIVERVGRAVEALVGD